jgi:hypothetical protein
VLVTSEQHLQRVGSDRRLLALLQLLRVHAAQVSLLVRTRKCNRCTHSPSVAELSSMLGSPHKEAMVLREDMEPAMPPAVYEYGGSRALLRLLHLASFDLVLVGVWFWYDPQPAFAELILPTLRGFASSVDVEAAWPAAQDGGVWTPPPQKTASEPPERREPRVARPVIGLFTDDAHSERARRLADEEEALAMGYGTGDRGLGAANVAVARPKAFGPAARGLATAAAYRTQARNLRARLLSIYTEVDAVAYLSAFDQASEAGLRADAARQRAWGAHAPSLPTFLLRMAVHADGMLRHASGSGGTGGTMRGEHARGRGAERLSSARAAVALSALSFRASAPLADAVAAVEPWIGFVGDGHTPTNALGVRRFVQEGWAAVRAEWPRARLRLVGRPPTSHRAGEYERAGGKDAPCAPDDDACGWVGGTVCAYNASACGIDTLGYVDDATLEAEAER